MKEGNEIPFFFTCHKAIQTGDVGVVVAVGDGEGVVVCGCAFVTFFC